LHQDLFAAQTQTYEEMRRELIELEDADVHFLGSLYAMAALDGETEAHLAVGLGGPARGPTGAAAAPRAGPQVPPLLAPPLLPCRRL
jgi:hypothetical protein